MTKKQLIGLALFIALIGFILFVDSSNFSQPAKLKGTFTETGFYRNQNNAGPVIRIYAVRVENPDGAAYEAYGNAMPHTVHGTTKVFFFNAKSPAPSHLYFNEPHFDTLLYRPIKRYEKNGVGDVLLKE